MFSIVNRLSSPLTRFFSPQSAAAPEPTLATASPFAAKDPTLLKILLIGNYEVNKSQFITTYTHENNPLSNHPITTIGVDLRVKKIEIDTIPRTLQIWDTGGQERLCSIYDHYYRGTKGILLFYNVSEPSSFNWIAHYLKQSIQFIEEMTIILIGETSDLAKGGTRQITEKQGKDLAELHGLNFLECSADDRDAVSNAFETLVRAEPEFVVEKGLADARAKVTPLHSTEMECLDNDTAGLVGDYLKTRV